MNLVDWMAGVTVALFSWQPNPPEEQVTLYRLTVQPVNMVEMASTYETSGTRYALSGLDPGDYLVTLQAINQWGLESIPSEPPVAVRFAAPSQPQPRPVILMVPVWIEESEDLRTWRRRERLEVEVIIPAEEVAERPKVFLRAKP